MVHKKMTRIVIIIMLLLAITAVFIGVTHSENEVDKHAMKLITHTEETASEIVNEIINTTSYRSKDWLERYIFTVAIEYGEKIGFIVSLTDTEDIKDIVDYDDICSLLEDENASIGRLFFGGQAAANFGNPELAKTLLWKAFQKTSNNQQKIRILDEIASYTVFKEYNYMSDGLIYGSKCNVPINLIDNQNIEECIGILSEYNTLLDEYSWFRHCRITPICSSQRMNYYELSFQVEYYSGVEGLKDIMYDACANLARNFPKLETDEYEEMIYRVYMYGFQSYILTGTEQSQSKVKYNRYKADIGIPLLYATVRNNIEMIDTLLSPGI